MRKRHIAIIILLTILVSSVPVHSSAETSISYGIKQFQTYINSHLPAEYRGAALSVDGSCGPLTKSAAIKLIQYYLNCDGANIAIDGGFGPASQSAFESFANPSSSHVRGRINKGDSGKWVYILQGLLYCHGYNPGGFDGSYGASGGTGCFYTTNKYKFDNWITEYISDENSNGIVSVNTMKFLTWRYADRTVQDGLYYIKNTYSNKYLTVDYSNRNVIQHSKYPSSGERESQLWKVTYVGDGRYCLRTCDSINFSMALFTGNNVGIYDLGLTDNMTTVVNGSAWNITVDSSNQIQIIWYANSNPCVQLSSSTMSENSNVVAGTNNGTATGKWILEAKETKQIPVNIYYEKSFSDYFTRNTNSSPNTVADTFYTYAWSPFRYTMGYIKNASVQRYPYYLESDYCNRLAENQETNPSPYCCNHVDHDISTNSICSQCKCIVRFLNSVNTDARIFNGFSSCMFLFNSCDRDSNILAKGYGGYAVVCGNSSVVKASRITNPNESEFLLTVRRVQHELSHNLGATDNSSSESCKSRCIMNSGLDFVRDYDIRNIWCNRCIGEIDIYKF